MNRIRSPVDGARSRGIYPVSEVVPRGLRKLNLLVLRVLNVFRVERSGRCSPLHAPLEARQCTRYVRKRKRGRSPKKTTPALYSFLRTSHRATTRASMRPSKLMSPFQTIETCGKVSHEARMSLDTLCLLAKPTSPVLIAPGFVIPALSRAVRGFRREIC